MAIGCDIQGPARLRRLWLATGAVTLALVGPAPAIHAQDEPTPSEPETKRPAPTIVAIAIGLGGRNLSGSESKYRQYGSPPTGWFVQELRLDAPWAPYDGFASAALRGYGADPLRAEAVVGLNGARHRLWTAATRNRFVDNTPHVVPDSNRKADSITYRCLVAPDFGLTARYATANFDHFFEAPREALRVRSREWDLTASGCVGQGSLGLGFSDVQFYDRLGTLPDTSIGAVQLSGLWAPGPEGDISGSVTSLTIERAGAGVGRVNTVAMAGAMSVGGIGDLSVRGENEHASWPTVESARVTDRRLVETALHARRGPVALNVRWQYREAERVRGDGEYLDVPKWTSVIGKLTTPLGRYARLALRGSTERMWQSPQMVTTDTRSAVWNQRDRFEATVEAGRDDLTGYASWRFGRRGNTVRGATVTNGTASVGATLAVTPGLELFADLSLERWTGRSDDVAFPTLASFMPDSRVMSVGASYALGRSSFLWVGYTDTTTDNDNPNLERDGNTESRYLSASLRHRFAAGQEVSLTVAPWTYRDKVDPTMNLTATTVVVSGRSRF